ncbi:nitroreductase family protein [Candidatus Omnitrophota bacterium]
MDILSLIKKRRTIRKYKDRIISNKIIKKIIESAIWAPSAHNIQPWKFIVLKDEITKQNFIDSLTKPILTEYSSSIRILIKNSIDILKRAPLVILVYNNCNLSKKVAELGKIHQFTAYLSEVESVAAAIENMHLVAHYLGIGMAWLTMPLFVKKHINKFFNTEDDLLALLALGYPAETGKRSKRKLVTEIVKYL